MGRWDNKKDKEEELEFPDDTKINLKWCERCKLAIQVDDDNEHIWAFCYMCGDPLKWYDNDKEKFSSDT